MKQEKCHKSNDEVCRTETRKKTNVERKSHPRYSYLHDVLKLFVDLSLNFYCVTPLPPATMIDCSYSWPPSGSWDCWLHSLYYRCHHRFPVLLLLPRCLHFQCPRSHYSRNRASRVSHFGHFDCQSQSCPHCRRFGVEGGPRLAADDGDAGELPPVASAAVCRRTPRMALAMARAIRLPGHHWVCDSGQCNYLCQSVRNDGKFAGKKGKKNKYAVHYKRAAPAAGAAIVKGRNPAAKRNMVLLVLLLASRYYERRSGNIESFTLFPWRVCGNAWIGWCERKWTMINEEIHLLLLFEFYQNI